MEKKIGKLEKNVHQITSHKHGKERDTDYCSLVRTLIKYNSKTTQ